MTDGLGVSSHETILSIAPLFQAHAWALPHAAALVGADLVLPGHDLCGPVLGELIRRHQVTMVAGPSPVLGELLAHANATPGILDSLRIVVSALQRPLPDGFARYGVEVIQGSGMSETSRCGTMPRSPLDADAPSVVPVVSRAAHPVTPHDAIKSGGEWDLVRAHRGFPHMPGWWLPATPAVVPESPTKRTGCSGHGI